MPDSKNKLLNRRDNSGFEPRKALWSTTGSYGGRSAPSCCQWPKKI